MTGKKKSDFLTSEAGISSAMAADEEVQKGSLVVKEKITEKSYGTFRRYFCGRCRSAIHNRPNNRKICSGHGCDCFCQVAYIGRDGYTLIPYDQPDTTKIGEREPPKQGDPKIIDAVNKQWKIIHAPKLQHCPRCCQQKVNDQGKIRKGKKTYDPVSKECSACHFSLGQDTINKKRSS